MPNICSRKRAPRYRLHKRTGQAVVTIDGRDIYLGKHGTTASREAYREKIDEWKRKLPNRYLSPPRYKASVTEVIVGYIEFASRYYRKDGTPTDEVRMIKTALKIVRKLYGRTPAAEFGPLALKACREQMIANDWCRTHINRQVDRVKRAIKWATENEMIPGTVYEALRCVAGLKRGRTEAREGRKVKPISDIDILATMEYLPPVVRDMVQLQRLCGGRPSEICEMRPGNINRRADPWEYVPQSHKTEHYDRPRVVFLGPQCQQLLMKYLLRPADAYCFSPREADATRRAAQHDARKTPISCGNCPGSNRQLKPRRTPGEKYDRNSYARAVRRAAQKAGVETWSPHRLRHSFATEVRKKYGLEAVQVTLGHAHASISEVYAQRDYALAARVAREVG